MSGLFTLFKSRKHEDEWMDLPSTSTGEFTEALRDIQWVNRNLGGTEVLLSAFQSMLPSDLPAALSVLDIGTGSADIPRALANWARAANHLNLPPLHITACDIHPVAVSVSRQLCQGYPEITVVQADALNLSYTENSFDIVISSMFLHHLDNAQAVQLLREMARISRIGLIVNDLERHPLAWLGIKTLGHLTRKGRIFKNDAPLSVLRGFDRSDLERLKQQSGLTTLEIQHHRPYRWVLCWRKENVSIRQPYIASR